MLAASPVGPRASQTDPVTSLPFTGFTHCTVGGRGEWVAAMRPLLEPSAQPQTLLCS